MPTNEVERLRSGSRVWILVAVFAATIASLGGLALTKPESARACDPSNHCWGTDRWNYASTNHGGYTLLTTNNTAVGDSCNQFATSEIWVGTNDSPIGGTWVETGVKSGKNTQTGACVGRRWFWAEFNTNINYYEHDTSMTVTLGTGYQTKITWAGSNTWSLYRDGYNFANSTSAQPCCSRALQAGGEVNTNSHNVDGTANSLQWKNTSDVWQSNWGNALVIDGVWNVGWYTTGAYLYYTICCVI